MYFYKNIAIAMDRKYEFERKRESSKEKKAP